MKRGSDAELRSRIEQLQAPNGAVHVGQASGSLADWCDGLFLELFRVFPSPRVHERRAD